MIIDVNEARTRARSVLARLTFQPPEGLHHRAIDVDIVAAALIEANGDGMKAIIEPLAAISPFTFDDGEDGRSDWPVPVKS